MGVCDCPGYFRRPVVQFEGGRDVMNKPPGQGIGRGKDPATEGEFEGSPLG